VWVGGIMRGRMAVSMPVLLLDRLFVAV
jgi:hypothetical protein